MHFFNLIRNSLKNFNNKFLFKKKNFLDFFIYKNYLKLILTSILFVITFLSIFYIFSFYFKIVIVKTLSIWIGVLLLFYWVLSAVWCLYDKDDYGRNVSASDDFYNTAFTAFWLIEGFLLSLFLSYARLFDFYEPFLESDEIEHSFLNEDLDYNNFLRDVVYFFLIAHTASFCVDFLIRWETFNQNWFATSLTVVLLFFVVFFFKLSVKFIEELDIEEDGEDIFDDGNFIFEHEDFPEEGVDGGDLAEGYETLQLFFGYWHYTFIVLHICYLVYAVFLSQGKQTHLYWVLTAICQNVLLVLILDYLDWGEIFSTFEVATIDWYYPWLFFTEDPLNSFLSIFSDLKQIFNYIISFFFFNKNNPVYELPNLTSIIN